MRLRVCPCSAIEVGLWQLICLEALMPCTCLAHPAAYATLYVRHVKVNTSPCYASHLTRSL